MWLLFVLWFRTKPVLHDKKLDYAIEISVSALATITAFWLAFVVVFYGVTQTESVAKAREVRLQRQLMSTRLFHVYQEVSSNKEAVRTIIWNILEGATHADAPIHPMNTMHADNLLNSDLYYRFGSINFRNDLLDVYQLTKDMQVSWSRLTEPPGVELLKEVLEVEEALGRFREVIQQEPEWDLSARDKEME